MTTHIDDATIVLIPGHWLGAWAWDDVVEHLTTLGRRALPMTLPGLDPADAARGSRTLDDQAAAIEGVVAQAAAADDASVVIVAHSGANAPVSLVLDRHPDLVRRVVWVDSGPMAPGSALASDLPETVDELPLPPFEALGAQASLEGLSAEVLERFRSRAVPQPGPVRGQSVQLSNDARRQVPTTLVCCSIPSEQVRELAGAGHPMFAEVTRLESVDYVDLPTGHWPMWSRPGDLARIIAAAATSPTG